MARKASNTGRIFSLQPTSLFCAERHIPDKVQKGARSRGHLTADKEGENNCQNSKHGDSLDDQEIVEGEFGKLPLTLRVGMR